MSNNFHKTSLLKNSWIETFGPRKRSFRKKLEGCSCARKHLVVFWTFHTFPCIFSREIFLLGVTAVSLYRQMYGKFKTRLDAFWHSYIPPFFSLNSFSKCQTFPIHEFFRSDVLWELFDIAFPYKHCFFKTVCLLVNMASKTVIRPIVTATWGKPHWELSTRGNKMPILAFTCDAPWFL